MAGSPESRGSDSSGDAAIRVHNTFVSVTARSSAPARRSASVPASQRWPAGAAAPARPAAGEESPCTPRRPRRGQEAALHVQLRSGRPLLTVRIEVSATFAELRQCIDKKLRSDCQKVAKLLSTSGEPHCWKAALLEAQVGDGSVVIAEVEENFQTPERWADPPALAAGRASCGVSDLELLAVSECSSSSTPGGPAARSAWSTPGGPAAGGLDFLGMWPPQDANMLAACAPDGAPHAAGGPDAEGFLTLPSYMSAYVPSCGVGYLPGCGVGGPVGMPPLPCSSTPSEEGVSPSSCLAAEGVSPPPPALPAFCGADATPSPRRCHVQPTPPKEWRPREVHHVANRDERGTWVHHVFWLVDSRKLKSMDKQAISPKFQLPLSERNPEVTFCLLIHPKASFLSKGGGSFKKAKGCGKVELKMEDSTIPAEDATLHFSFMVGSKDPNKVQPKRGPISHNFVESSNAGLPKALEDWDFSHSVDDVTQKFIVSLEVQDMASDGGKGETLGW